MAAYPRKQTVAIFILCAFAVGGVAYHVYGHGLPPDVESNEQEITTLASAANTLVSDEEWEEQFLSGGPGNGAFKPVEDASNNAPSENLSPTDELGRNFLKKYVSLKQQGLTENTEAVANAMNEAISESVGNLVLPQAYDATDVKVVPATSLSVSAYSSVIAQVMQRYTSSEDEIFISVQAFEKGDESILKGIDPIIKNYQEILAKLKSSSVPDSMTAYHVDLLNGFSASLYGAQSLRKIASDPVEGMLAVKLNAMGTEMIAIAAENIRNHGK